MKEYLYHFEFHEYVKERLSNTDFKCDECDFREWENCKLFNAVVETTSPGDKIQQFKRCELCREWFNYAND